MTHAAQNTHCVINNGGVIRGDCVLHIICTHEGQEQGGQMNDLQFYVLFNSISVKG